MKPTQAQLKALAAIGAQRVVYTHRTDRFHTLSKDFPRARQDVLNRIIEDGLAEIIFRESTRQGVVILTDAGRDALWPNGMAA